MGTRGRRGGGGELPLRGDGVVLMAGRRGFMGEAPDVRANPARPGCVEVMLVGGRGIGRRDDDGRVLLPAPRVVGAVGGAGPDRLAITDHVLVMHEIGDPVDRLGRDGFAQQRQQRWPGRGRGGRVPPIGLVVVVDRANPNAA